MIKKSKNQKVFVDNKIILFPIFKKEPRGDNIKSLKLAWLACIKSLRSFV
jgi:hypothetical protein